MRKAGREMPRYVVSIVRVGARLATCHSDERFGNRARKLEGRSRYSSLSLSGRPSEVSAAEEGPTSIILKGPVQFSESFSLKTLLSAPFRNPWRIVATVL